MRQNYGILRIVRVRLPANATANILERYPSGWLPEERLVHVLTQRKTTIGRALNNDIILLDPTVSREHARLVLDDAGWHIINLTTLNVVRVNGTPVPSGTSYPLEPQDILILGSTMLQLVAPQKFPMAASDVELFVELLPASFTPTEKEALSAQFDVEPAAGDWDSFEENVPGVGVTMQFALPQRVGARTRWFIAGVSIVILVVSTVVTLVLNGLVGLSTLAQYGPIDLLAAIVIPVIPAVGIGLLVNFMDRFEREPWFLRLAAFLWGAVIAIPIAFFVERKLDTALLYLSGPNASDVIRSALQGLNAGITEETIKGAGLLLLFVVLRDEFDNVTDGLVYAALIGAGFAMVENFRYFANDFEQFPVFLIVYRIILGWLGHSTFIACFGAGLGYIRHTRVRWRQIAFPLSGYLLAVSLHGFFDFVDFQASAALNAAPGNNNVAFLSLMALIGDYIPPFLTQMALLYILMKALAHEAAIIREFLAVEVSNGVVKVDEYVLLQNSFQRTKVERRVLRKQGWRQWMRVRALYQTEIGLAFRKWHVSMGDQPKLGYLQPEDAYRKRIKRLHYEIAAHRH